MMFADKKNNLLLLFVRPLEPTFLPKGKNNLVFDVPEDYLVDKYKTVGRELITRFEESPKVSLAQISKPYLKDVLTLKRDGAFSIFVPRHRLLAGQLLNIFLDMKTPEDLLSAAVYARDRVNPQLFVYSLTVALLHRPDTSDLSLPSLVFSFPDHFFNAKVINEAKEMVFVVPEALRTPIVAQSDTASDLEIEHRLAYFREDPGVNLHHYHWHVVYPNFGNLEVIKKDRRGELFYYMHQQIIARYNFERLSNKLMRVRRFNNFKSEIEQAYFPKLQSQVTGGNLPARVANQKLHDLSGQHAPIDVDDMERWRDRILEAIASGKVRDDKGNDIQLTETEGIDILGNVVEASILSPNFDFYGDLHNVGHAFFSLVHDPDYRYLEEPGVMGDFATAMRDPIFYRWHAFLDYVFQAFKSTLPSYKPEELHYAGVRVEEVSVQTENLPNVIETMWETSEIDISSGLNFQNPGALCVQFKHLQHSDFSYNIVVSNNNKDEIEKKGTCRIFLAPKFDERNETFSFNDQRHLFIELDKFTVTLKPGKNILTRKAADSSVTISFDQIFQTLNLIQTTGDDQSGYCGCGWPGYLLIPKGKRAGFQCQMFVMISNYDLDRVDNGVPGACKEADSFCGLKDKKYPDRRAMGYPFDRKADPEKVKGIDCFLTPNMFLKEITIEFTGKTIGKIPTTKHSG